MALAALISSTVPAAIEGGERAITVRIARLRQAGKDDCGRIAELFRMASGGVSDYVWLQMAPLYPGAPLLEIGARRFEREGVGFSWQNCTIAEYGGEVIGMCHAFALAARVKGEVEHDPVLRPYAELELPGSLYTAGLAVAPEFRNQGLGSRLLGAARREARARGIGGLSLLCFEQNEGARRLYERSGFRVVDRRKVVPHPLIHHRGDVLLMAAYA
jgi:ribosomal protein S18 acetylase RimI-like enzyme